jgi:hypothetical protein
MTLQTELRKLGVDLASSTDVRVCEINPTLTSATADKMIKDVADHARKASKTRTAVVISFVKSR